MKPTLGSVSSCSQHKMASDLGLTDHLDDAVLASGSCQVQLAIGMPKFAKSRGRLGNASEREFPYPSNVRCRLEETIFGPGSSWTNRHESHPEECEGGTKHWIKERLNTRCRGMSSCLPLIRCPVFANGNLIVRRGRIISPGFVRKNRSRYGLTTLSKPPVENQT